MMFQYCVRAKYPRGIILPYVIQNLVPKKTASAEAETVSTDPIDRIAHDWSNAIKYIAQ